MPDIVFDEAAHRYYVRGVWVPNVTLVLKDLVDLSRIPPATLEYARLRGTATHKAIELYHSPDGLDWSSLSEPIRRRLDQYLEFLQRSSFTPTLVEHATHHRELGYAGKIDLFGFFPGGRFSLIDVKTGMVEPIAGPQTAAYKRALLFDTHDALNCDRYALHLQEDRYSLIPLADPADWSVFLNRLIEWKTQNRK